MRLFSDTIYQEHHRSWGNPSFPGLTGLAIFNTCVTFLV
jgi:hypothetical protein